MSYYSERLDVQIGHIVKILFRSERVKINPIFCYQSLLLLVFYTTDTKPLVHNFVQYKKLCAMDFVTESGCPLHYSRFLHACCINRLFLMSVILYRFFSL